MCVEWMLCHAGHSWHSRRLHCIFLLRLVRCEHSCGLVLPVLLGSFCRGLHGLLLIKRTCHECGNNVPRARECTDAKLVRTVSFSAAGGYRLTCETCPGFTFLWAIMAGPLLLWSRGHQFIGQMDRLGRTKASGSIYYSYVNSTGSFCARDI